MGSEGTPRPAAPVPNFIFSISSILSIYLSMYLSIHPNFPESPDHTSSSYLHPFFSPPPLLSLHSFLPLSFADPSSRVPGTLRDARTQEFCPTRTRNGLGAVMISERLASKAALLRGAKNPPNHKLHRTAGGLAKETKARGEQQEGTAPCSPGLPLSPS